MIWVSGPLRQKQGAGNKDIFLIMHSDISNILLKFTNPFSFHHFFSVATIKLFKLKSSQSTYYSYKKRAKIIYLMKKKYFVALALLYLKDKRNTCGEGWGSFSYNNIDYFGNERSHSGY